MNAEERKKRLVELANELAGWADFIDPKMPEKAMMKLYDRHYNRIWDEIQSKKNNINDVFNVIASELATIESISDFRHAQIRVLFERK